ncbi:Non-histone chromosomal protein 6 [Podila epicladia]|nr:Non-histone chromosomal protein 6 [Podila epicladia]KAG0095116.1 Non-histone chromosomal protein 6 [Podila epicladia]
MNYPRATKQDHRHNQYPKHTTHFAIQKATKDVKASLKSEPKPKEFKAKRDTKNSNNNKEFKEKSKIDKDSNAPKRPLSAYMLYCADARDKVKEENPGAPMTGITRILGRQWREPPDDVKSPYETKHKVAKNHWEIEKAFHEKGINLKSLSEDAIEEDTRQRL